MHLLFIGFNLVFGESPLHYSDRIDPVYNTELGHNFVPCVKIHQ